MGRGPRHDEGMHRATDDGRADDEKQEAARPIIPFGGLNQVWGVLMATKSDDPAEMAEIRRQRRRVAALMVLTTIVGVGIMLLVYVR